MRSRRKKLIENFYNEIKNEISISVEKTKDMNKEKKKKFDAVRITIEGPNSVSDNTITNMEAVKLNDLLTEFIGINNLANSIVKDANKKNKTRKGMKSRWSVKHKRNIDCGNPKGFSQKQYCKRKKRGGKYKEE